MTITRLLLLPFLVSCSTKTSEVKQTKTVEQTTRVETKHDDHFSKAVEIREEVRDPESKVVETRVEIEATKDKPKRVITRRVTSIKGRVVIDSKQEVGKVEKEVLNVADSSSHKSITQEEKHNETKPALASCGFGSGVLVVYLLACALFVLWVGKRFLHGGF